MAEGTTIQQSGSIESTEGLPIRYDLHTPAGEYDALPLVLFLHGFKGFKDWGPFPEACAALASDGFAVLAINFSLNGVGESLTEFDRLDLFARETFTQDLNDIDSVIEAVRSGEIAPEHVRLNADKIGVVGHSRGGHTAVAAAAEFPGIACLVTWSAVADYNARWSEQMIADWKERGYTEIMNGRTGQVMRIDREVYEDARENADRVIARNRVEELTIPALFIHSKDDESVPHTEAEMLYRSCASDRKELKLLQDTGHTYGGAHPFEEDSLPGPLQEVVEATSAWLSEGLKAQ